MIPVSHYGFPTPYPWAKYSCFHAHLEIRESMCRFISVLRSFFMRFSYTKSNALGFLTCSFYFPGQACSANMDWSQFIFSRTISPWAFYHSVWSGLVTWRKVVVVLCATKLVIPILACDWLGTKIPSWFRSSSGQRLDASNPTASIKPVKSPAKTRHRPTRKPSKVWYGQHLGYTCTSICRSFVFKTF